MRKIQATKYLWITLLIAGIFAVGSKTANASVLVYDQPSIASEIQTVTSYCFQGPNASCLGSFTLSATTRFTDGVSKVVIYGVRDTGGINVCLNISNIGVTKSTASCAQNLPTSSGSMTFVQTGNDSGGVLNYTDLPAGTYYVWFNQSVNTTYYKGAGTSQFGGYVSTDGSAPVTDVTTRFISVAPTASSTVSTSTPTTIGGHVYVNPSDYVAGKTFLRMSFNNYTASLVTGSALQAWDTAFNNFLLPITASSTDLDVSTSTDKFQIYQGKTEGTYQIVVEDCSWYSFLTGCNYTPLIASSTYFYIGGKTGFDLSQEAGQLGIFGLAPGSDPFAATTTNAVLDCNIGISFDIYKCMWSFVIPNGYLTNQVVTNYKSLPVLGWPIRFVEIMITTTATTSLPTINYTFSNNNSFVGGVNIHFNPWQYMFTSGSLVKDQFVADDGSGNIWDIMGPFVKLVVYLTLGFVIIRRLTGLNWGGDYTTTETGSETISTSEKLPDGARKTYTHSITKRRKL